MNLILRFPPDLPDFLTVQHINVALTQARRMRGLKTDDRCHTVLILGAKQSAELDNLATSHGDFRDVLLRDESITLIESDMDSEFECYCYVP